MKRLYSPVRLIEAKDKEGKDWEVCIIETGWSLNNKFYPKEVLKKAIPLFEDIKSFAYEFKGKLFNHLPEMIRKVLPQGVAKNVVGWYDNVHYGTFKDAEGKTKEGLLGRFHIAENAKWLRQYLLDAWEHGKKTLMGHSIDAGGDITEVESRNGKPAWHVNLIGNVDEVTVVTYPGAGGQPVRLLASKNFHEEEGNMDFLKKLYEWAKKIKESAIEGIDAEKITDDQAYGLMKVLVESEDFLKIGDEQFKESTDFTSEMNDKLMDLVEAGKKEDAIKLLKQFQSKVKEYAKPPVKESDEEKAKKAKEAKEKEEAKKAKEKEDAKKSKESKEAKEAEEKRRKELSDIEKVKEDVDKMKEETAVAKSGAILEKILAESKLPKLLKEKVRKQFLGKVFEQKELEEAVKDEKDTYSKLMESDGNIDDSGDTKVEVVTDEMEKVLSRVDLTFDEDAEVSEKLKESHLEGFTSLKELYKSIYPEDQNITGIVGKRDRVGRLKESITTSDITFILGTSITRKIVREFKVKPFLFDPIVTQTGISDFKQQERTKWGGWSTFPSVTEDADYADGLEPKDEKATYTAATKGYTVGISRKTIKNDDLGYMKMIPMKIIRAGKNTLQRDVANLLLTNGTYTPTNSTAFSTLFANYSTAAMSYDSLTDSSDGIAAQMERGAVQDSGTASSATSTVLTDSTKAFTVDAFIGEYLRIVYGTGAGQMLAITDNDATTITVAAFATTPDSTSRYEVSTAQNLDEEMGLEGKFIVHGLKTRAKVRTLINSDKNPNNMAEDNVHKGAYKSIYCPIIKGSTYQYYWFLIIPKEDGPTIEIGFVDNQRVPQLVVQDQPSVGQAFTKDRIRYRVRYEYGLEIIDNKGIYANFATSV